MRTYVALLRGINVGGKNVLKMAELRDIIEDLGARDVATYIQSGNVVFNASLDTDGFADLLEQDISDRHGFRPRVLVIDADAYAEVARAFPFETAWETPKTGHIWFLDTSPSAPDLAKLAALASETERYHLTDSAFYLHAPDGIGRSKLAAKAEDAIGVSATARNLNTVNKLLDLIENTAQAIAP